MKVVRIDWIDSSYTEGWNTLDYWDNDTAKNVKSIGWEIKRTDQYIVIAAAIADEPEQACAVITIPMQSIVSIRYLAEEEEE